MSGPPGPLRLLPRRARPRPLLHYPLPLPRSRTRGLWGFVGSGPGLDAPPTPLLVPRNVLEPVLELPAARQPYRLAVDAGHMPLDVAPAAAEARPASGVVALELSGLGVRGVRAVRGRLFVDGVAGGIDRSRRGLCGFWFEPGGELVFRVGRTGIAQIWVGSKASWVVFRLPGTWGVDVVRAFRPVVDAACRTAKVRCRSFEWGVVRRIVDKVREQRIPSVIDEVWW